MKTLGLIPARGGSKGIPRKNVKSLGNKPLIGWTIDAALRSDVLDAVVVSTEDAEIAETARRLGADVPFIRPTELAQDDTPTLAAVLHALDCLPDFDAVLLLQPTSPLRSAHDIRDCMSLADDGAHSVISVCEAQTHPYWAYLLTKSGRLEPFLHRPTVARRQDLPPAYALNGALYFARTDWLRSTGAFVGPDSLAYVMPASRSLDLDTPLDWKVAELLIEEASC